MQFKKLLIRQNYPNVFATGENEYISFWKQLTDRVEPYSYRLFSHYMGYNPCIVPDYIGSEIISYYLNPRRYSVFYEDKNAYISYIQLKDCLPITYLYRIGGGKLLVGNLDTKSVLLSFDLKREELYEILSKNGIDKVVLKPTIDSCSGQGVLLFSKQNNCFISNNGDVLSGNFLKSYNDDFVLQETIVQHPDLAKFNPSSVNTLRICTYRSVQTEEINVTGALIRIGKQGSVVDNAHAGGCFVGIDIETGILQHVAHDQYGGNYSCWNAIDFEDNTFVIPQWDSVKSFAVEVAKCNKHSRLLALDITVDEKCNPKLIEINIEGFSYWLFLFCGQNIFIGETQSVVDFCKDRMLKDGRNKLV